MGHHTAETVTNNYRPSFQFRALRGLLQTTGAFVAPANLCYTNVLNNNNNNNNNNND